MAFIVTSLLIAAFVINVVVGAVSSAPLVGSVAEMLVLLSAAIAFSVGILQREAAENNKQSKQ